MDSLKSKFAAVVRALEQGKEAEALEGLLWIHDNPDKSDPSSEMYRRAYGFLALAVLAKKYGPAKSALLELIQKHKESLSVNEANESAQADLGALEAAVRDMDV